MKVNRGLLILIVLSAFLILESCCPCCEDSKDLPVTLWPQETSQWCWAACGQMCMDFLGNNVSQCVQANNQFSPTNCCNSPIPNNCDSSGWPEFNKYNFTSKNTSNSALSWNKIRKEISCENRPITYSYHLRGGGGHMVSVFGYTTIASNGEKLLHFYDPLPVNTGSYKTITYTAYVAGNPGSSHWNDYYNIKPN